MISQPLIKDIKKSDNAIEMLLSFSKNAEYFQGHFPLMPVLPGFVQVHFAAFFAKEHFLINKDITNIKRLRFTKIISPNKDIFLTIQLNSPQKITFKYFTKKDDHSSGEIHFC